MFLADYFKDFENYLTNEKRYSSHTIRAYTDDLIQCNDFLCETYSTIELDQIKATHIRTWLAYLKENTNTAKTINRKISTLKSYYKFLQTKEVVLQSPLIHITSPKISKRLPQYVEQKDIKTLLQHIPFTNDFVGLLHRAIIATFYYTGMRLSELENLQLNHIDLYNNSLKVLGKGNKERLLPIVHELKTEITNYFEKRKELEIIIDPTFFLVNEKGKKLYAKYIYNVVNKYLKLVTTIDKKSPHILRHSFATHLSNNGAELNAVKELLGHSSLAATQIYTHNSIDKLKAIHKKAHPKS
jgi:integrase/recombinase XerC